MTGEQQSSHLPSRGPIRTAAAGARDNVLSKRAWLVFVVIQSVGCVLASYGTLNPESAFARGSWLIGFFLLLPGNLPALAVALSLTHFQNTNIDFLFTVACNAILWVTCSGFWKLIRQESPTRTYQRYELVGAATVFVFVMVNTLHSFRPDSCLDCLVPYGLPFTFYRVEGAGGGEFVLQGLAADAATVIVIAVLLSTFWDLAARRGLASVQRL